MLANPGVRSPGATGWAVLAAARTRSPGTPRPARSRERRRGRRRSAGGPRCGRCRPTPTRWPPSGDRSRPCAAARAPPPRRPRSPGPPAPRRRAAPRPPRHAGPRTTPRPVCPRRATARTRPSPRRRNLLVRRLACRGTGRQRVTAPAGSTADVRSGTPARRRCRSAPARPGRRRRPRRGGRAGAAGRPGWRAGSGTRPAGSSPARASTSASAAAGPSTIDTATARLRATTGDGHTRSSSSYSATIWGQSVAS